MLDLVFHFLYIGWLRRHLLFGFNQLLSDWLNLRRCYNWGSSWSFRVQHVEQVSVSSFYFNHLFYLSRFCVVRGHVLRFLFFSDHSWFFQQLFGFLLYLIDIFELSVLHILSRGARCLCFLRDVSWLTSGREPGKWREIIVRSNKPLFFQSIVFGEVQILIVDLRSVYLEIFAIL